MWRKNVIPVSLVRNFDSENYKTNRLLHLDNMLVEFSIKVGVDDMAHIFIAREMPKKCNYITSKTHILS